MQIDNELIDPTYEEWVRFVFDHPEPREPSAEEREADRARHNKMAAVFTSGETDTYRKYPELFLMPDWYVWHWHDDAPIYDETANSARTVAYLTRAFENIAATAASYTDKQMDIGLNYILSNACSNHVFAITDAAVPLADRERCVLSFYNVYQGLYAVRCSPHLGHLSEGGNPLNMTCYMWWDIIPFYPGSNPELTDAGINVMEQTLALPNIACQEGALHGLGHWEQYAEERVHTIIDAWLAANPSAPANIRTYAQNARRGYVL